MNQLNRILVVIDPTENNQKALSRAMELASKLPSSKVTVYLTIYDFSYEMTTMLSPDERESMRNAVIQDRHDWLAELVAETKTTYENIETKVVWHNRPFESIIRTVIEGEYDVVVKATHEHDVLKSVIFTPTDWHLLRKCPCSVLLVKEHAWPEDGKILAAVNAGTEDEDHQALNTSIIKQAQFMGSLLHSKTHLVNAYPPTPMNIAVEIPEFDPSEYNSTMKHHHQTSLSKLAVENDIEPEALHCDEGMPEDVIPRIAKELDAELVVIGTVGRNGISAALIGNTAEHVIDNLNCDLLAIKPPGFESPVKL